MAIPKERFTSIKTEVIDVLSVLAESFDPDKDANLQLENHRQALGKYINCIARIGMAAGAIGFSGLRDACVIFQNYLRGLYGQNRILTAQERDAIEEWPILVMSYLSGDGDSSSGEEIVRYLNNVIEEATPDEAEFNDISQQLISEQKPTLADKASDPGSPIETQVFVADDIPSSNASKVDNTAHCDELSRHVVSPSDEGADSPIFLDVSEEIRCAIQELTEELDERGHTVISRNDRTIALQLYSDRLEIIGMSLSETGWLGITDCIFIYNEGVKQLTDDADQFQYGLDDITPCAMLITRYLENPGSPDVSIELISALQSDPWIPDISDGEAQTLLDMLIPEKIEINITETDNDNNDSIDCPENRIISQQQDKTSASAVPPSADERNDSEFLAIPESLDKLAVELDDNVVELLALVKIEIDSIRPHLEDLLRQAFESDSEDVLHDSLTDYIEQLDRFVLAADSVGLHGLSSAMEFLSQNVQSICDSKIIDVDIYVSLHEWHEHVINYLADVNSITNVNSLLEYLATSVWPTPMSQAMLEELQIQLLSPVIEFEEEDSAPQRPETVSDEDVSLKLPEDVNPDLLDSLLRELPGHTSSFSDVIAHLSEGKGQIEDVARAQRIAHTLKGAANTVGVPGISNLTHNIEDILSVFTKHERLPGAALSDSLMTAADTLESMSESLLGIGPAPSDTKPVLQDILNWANHVDVNGIPSDDSQIPPVSDYREPQSSFEQTPESGAETDTDDKNSIATDTFLRVSTELVDELLRIVGEKIINNGRLLENLRRADDYNRAAQEHNKSLQQLVFELEKQVDLQGKGNNNQVGNFQSDKFDSLEMDQYNELHTITRQLVEAASDSQEFAFNIDGCLVEIEDLLIEQGRLSKQNRDSVMKTRMVPVSNIVPRLQRGVRQIARLTDKKVFLDISGQDTLVDGQVINNLVDPLMHILRNSIDHGIESYDERVSIGKDQTGTISLSFFKDGDEIIVLCQDDGAGFDYDAIKDTAIKRNLIQSADEVSESDLHKFILHHGFSTRDEVTQVSGRGVGLDAVFNQIIDLKGTMNVGSVVGHGVSIELRLPVSFVSVHGIVVRQQNQFVAFSSRGIEQILYPEAGVLSYENDQAYYTLNDEHYEVLLLGDILGSGGIKDPDVAQNKPALLVRLDDGKNTVVMIDDVVASQELVIKPLGDYIPPIAGIEGGTILGDGSVAAVIDLPDLVGSGLYQNANNDGIDKSRSHTSELTTALIVDDSLSARRSLSEFLQDMGYAILTARDGLEAIESIEAHTPDIVLVDMEMPRMNGLELTSHLRAKLEYKHIPIVMVTSRSTEKHRRQASSAGVDYYMVKPFSEEELLLQVERLLKENNAYAQPA
ncbi:MAG: response regulator [Thiohalophilus sp.]|uniref:hybrid sensor histidine kinase/response regulator n=1 Tax=Thiohalophilus sp. TaxID=3028392 RepID=UPI00286FF817|nr:response regulator [Thiohalophilus sp.]MDR9435239.1 response regulator [Thiohalophilus sp.]